MDKNPNTIEYLKWSMQSDKVAHRPVQAWGSEFELASAQ